MKIWELSHDLATLTCVRTVNGLEDEGHSNTTRCLAALSDGWVSGSYDQTLKWWNGGPFDGGFRTTMGGHGEDVNAVAVLPGDRVVSAAADGTLRFWDEGSCLQCVIAGDFLSCGPFSEGERPAPINAVAVLRDGRVASGGDDGKVKIWYDMKREIAKRSATALARQRLCGDVAKCIAKFL